METMKRAKLNQEKINLTPEQEIKFQKFVIEQGKRLREYIAGKEVLGDLISERCNLCAK